MSIEKLRWMVLASLMAALTAVGAYIYVPIGPVPIVLSTLFVILSGLLLGSRWGPASMALYLLVGAIGIPVFAGGKGGFAHFFPCDAARNVALSKAGPAPRVRCYAALN